MSSSPAMFQHSIAKPLPPIDTRAGLRVRRRGPTGAAAAGARSGAGSRAGAGAATGGSSSISSAGLSDPGNVTASGSTTVRACATGGNHQMPPLLPSMDLMPIMPSEFTFNTRNCFPSISSIFSWYWYLGGTLEKDSMSRCRWGVILATLPERKRIQWRRPWSFACQRPVSEEVVHGGHSPGSTRCTPWHHVVWPSGVWKSSIPAQTPLPPLLETKHKWLSSERSPAASMHTGSPSISKYACPPSQMISKRCQPRLRSTMVLLQLWNLPNSPRGTTPVR
mmetsp:Transcript_113199/g.320395  ORF Transcript_113199/g.320395 Transcript_113199/m.320395 type:complete len:279 (+) Transcript_113199:479-1315(+)